jgi:FixJ family two-component response regulator
MLAGWGMAGEYRKGTFMMYPASLRSVPFQFGLPVLRKCDKKDMKDTPLLVSVVDDDESVREALPDLLNEFGFSSRAFSSAEQFLASDCVVDTKCLILDIAMPGMTGLDLQQELGQRQQAIPIVFISALRDERVRAQVFERGAIAYLKKPFSDIALLHALNTATGLS